MPLPRYSLDDGGDGDEDTFEESYTSAASASRLPGSSNQARASTSFSQTPSVAGERSFSPSLSAYDAPSSLDVDALLESTPSSHLKATHSRQPQPLPSSTGWPYSSSSSPLARLTPFEQLTHFMSTQKASPEILPFPTTPFDSLVGQMEQQQSILDSLLHLSAASMSVDGEDAEGGEEGVGGGVDEDEYLRLNLVQVDLERCKWLLKQILRMRMDLLQKYAGFVVGRTGERRKLNDAEARFVNEFWQLKKDHLQSSVLGYLPEQLHDLTTGEQTDDGLSQQDAQQPRNSSNMVPGPDLDAPVFIRCLQDCGSIRLPDNEEATLSNDSVHLLRYRSIRHLVYQGSVVLL
ncbi:DNA replication complex GINS protein SLD5 [Pseudozyma hubeiensis]|nr:DNA replication complex GINS protein SLD5 [Pseudozyma hubeiensis]